MRVIVGRVAHVELAWATTTKKELTAKRYIGEYCSRLAVKATLKLASDYKVTKYSDPTGTTERTDHDSETSKAYLALDARFNDAIAFGVECAHRPRLFK